MAHFIFLKKNIEQNLWKILLSTTLAAYFNWWSVIAGVTSNVNTWLFTWVTEFLPCQSLANFQTSFRFRLILPLQMLAIVQLGHLKTVELFFTQFCQFKFIFQKTVSFCIHLCHLFEFTWTILKIQCIVIGVGPFFIHFGHF